jgi:hypothetical protein
MLLLMDRFLHSSTGVRRMVGLLLLRFVLLRLPMDVHLHLLLLIPQAVASTQGVSSRAGLVVDRRLAGKSRRRGTVGDLFRVDRPVLPGVRAGRDSYGTGGHLGPTDPRMHSMILVVARHHSIMAHHHQHKAKCKGAAGKTQGQLCRGL